VDAGSPGGESAVLAPLHGTGRSTPNLRLKARPLRTNPVDAHVGGDLVHAPRDLAAEVVHLAVVAAGVDSEVVSDDALDAAGQAVATKTIFPDRPRISAVDYDPP
jgi:hypothetical protein